MGPDIELDDLVRRRFVHTNSCRRKVVPAPLFQYGSEANIREFSAILNTKPPVDLLRASPREMVEDIWAGNIVGEVAVMVKARRVASIAGVEISSHPLRLNTSGSPWEGD